MTTTVTSGGLGASGIDATYKKVALRLMPYIFVCYLFNYLDRVNVGFAKLQMLDDLGLSETAYGLGAGIFFLGYVAFGVPSNLMLHRFGARRWIALIMVLWGLLSTSLLFVRSAESFYVLRFLTGAAEAGFFPGIVLYLTKWFPSARRGGVMALFMSAIPLSGVLGGPFSGWILGHFTDGQAGMHAWQWLFLLQGLPTVVLGIGILAVLSNGIDDARFLSSDEKAALKQALVEDDKNRPTTVSDSFAAVLRNKGVWALGVIYFSIQSGVYMINFWLPSIIKASGQTDPALVGWLSAIPYLAASVFMLYVGRSADRHRERRLHLAIPMLMGVGGLMVAANFSASPTIALIGLTIATMGALTGLPMFWPISGGYLSPTAMAGGLALINSIGQIAGFVSPYMVGWIKDTTQSTDTALYILAAIILVGVVLVLRIPGKLVNR
ncbi:putative metabolite transport protein NicT [uncultured Pleomorphomonas sp.]|uniref:Putative tartrate transporter n=1 Tax=uncultured Pleomorphomonas sp. TaxID=442121 RepID=A0A212L635_9HYPH|nr:MFS transporter [uncultured Pleomorphomonas sp.]SCM73023.1 putative metabolite transport protein NicT [uncultured Pleomorphomonas sp.]